MSESNIQIVKLNQESVLWQKAILFAESCSWIAGKHFAEMLRNNAFEDWEAAFAAVHDGHILGFCTFLKEDYYPENRYSPWISSVFVTEAARGNRISHKMIEYAVDYAKEKGFSRVYIPSDLSGFYEKCGFTAIDSLMNYAGDWDTIFAKDIGCIS